MTCWVRGTNLSTLERESARGMRIGEPKQTGREMACPAAWRTLICFGEANAARLGSGSRLWGVGLRCPARDVDAVLPLSYSDISEGARTLITASTIGPFVLQIWSRDP